MTTLPNDLPEPIADVGDDWPPIPVSSARVTFSVTIPEVGTLPEVIDLAMVTIARFGLEPLDVYIEDADVPGRDWVVRQGVLYDMKEIREAAGDDGPADPDS